MTVQPYSATAQVKSLAGTAAAPGLTFTGDTDTGLFSPGANQISITTGGVQRLLVGSDGSITPSGSLLFPAGTATAPSVAFTGDSDTGLYSPGANQVAISTGGTGRLFVDASGNVGVGTNTPNVLLHLDQAPAAAGTAGIIGFGDLGNYRFAEIEGYREGGSFAGSLIFRTQTFAGISTSGAERMRLDSNGRLGLGTSSPGTLLDVNGAAKANYSIVTGALAAYASTTGGLYSYFASTAGTINAVTDNSGTAGTLILATGTERARIDSAGRLLVGTSTSVNVGTIVGTTQQIATSGQPLSLRRFSNSTVGPNILFGKTRATVDNTFTIVQNGDTLGGLIFAGSDGVDLETPGAAISAEVDGTPGSNDMPGRLVFSTTADGAATPTERVRIDSSGNLGVGVTSPAVASFGNVIRNKAPAGTGASGYFAEGANSDTWFGIYSGTGTSDSASLIYPSTGSLRIATSTGVGVGGFNERIRIDSSGRLLVGTSAATQNFDGGTTIGIQVENTGNSNKNLLRLVSNATNNWPPIFSFARSRGTANGSVVSVASEDSLGGIVFAGSDGTGHIPAANIQVIVDGTPGTNDMPGRLVFSTTADGGSAPTERLRIDSTGQIEAGGLGTAASPVWSFLADPNTGLYSPGADQVAITTAGTQKFAIDSFDGNPIIETSYPLIRPTLDLNFAATKRLDPRITFSRSSTGTYVDSEGLIKSAPSGVARFDHSPVTGESLGLLVEESRTNFLLYSRISGNPYGGGVPFGFTGWNPTSVLQVPSIAPDGLINITLHASINNNGGGFRQSVTGLVSGGTYTLSWYARTVTSSELATFIAFHGATTGSVGGATNQPYVAGTSTGWGAISVSGTGASGGGSFNSALTSAWQRFSGTVTADSAGSIAIIINGGTGATEGRVFAMWGAQLEAGSFSTSYIPTPATFSSRSSTATYYDATGILRTAAVNEARSAAFFPDSSGVFRPAGLLIESLSATNLVTYSQEFDNAAWSWTSGTKTVTANSIAAPDGTTTADTVDCTAGFIEIATPSGSGIGGVKTFSVFLKAGTLSAITLRSFSSVGTSEVTAEFNSSTGIISSVVGGASASAKIEKLPNGWYRCSLSRLNSDASLHGAAIRALGGTFYAWGAQLETGSYPTSYIPTTTTTVTRAADVSSSATVTRSADVVNITGTNFSSWYNQSEGTLLASVRTNIPASASNGFIFQLTDGTTNNRIELGQGASGDAFPRLSGQFRFLNSTTVTFTNQSTGWIPDGLTVNNIAFAWNSTGFSLYDKFDTSPATGTGTYPQNLTQTSLGHRGTISRFTYYPSRLPNATLQTITR